MRSNLAAFPSSEPAPSWRPAEPAPEPDGTPPPRALAALLARADVRFNGGRPWDIQVHRPRLYGRMLAQWSLGAGEAYMDGDWDCERLDELFTRVMRADLDRAALGRARWRLGWEALRHGLLNLQSPARAFQVGRQHYDVGNDVFEAMLDARMVYSCGYWAKAATLDEAQADKLEMVCRKLELQRGERLLDIGCGWGALARHAAEHHGARVTGITVSAAQLALARERCAGLPVDFRLMDYRGLRAGPPGAYDKVASVGMFEHVGPKNYPAFFDTVRHALAPEGLLLLHTIGVDVPTAATDPWIDRYVFPNGKLPAPSELAQAVEGRFVIEDWHAFGPDYDRTLMCWWQRFDAAWPRLAARYPGPSGERMRRLWQYYLLSCAGFFRSRQGQLWQLVLSPRHRQAVYRSIRP